MASQLEYFRQFALEFAALTDTVVGNWLTTAGLFALTDCLDAERAALATALYAAHLAWVTQNQASGSGTTGAIKSEREGDLARTYVALSGDNTWIGQSPYGQQYLSITSACVGSTIMTRYGTQSYY